uniref:Uncharacterized protein n=1 Tax=Trichuris muris TaxID=70415 RepID=A0A5S6QIJ8_TRIMR
MPETRYLGAPGSCNTAVVEEKALHLPSASCLRKLRLLSPTEGRCSFNERESQPVGLTLESIMEIRSLPCSASISGSL